MTARAATLLFCAALLCASGCNGCGKKADSEGASTGGPAKLLVQPPAVLEGVVRLADGFELPAYTRDQMEKRVLAQTEHAPLPESCSPPKTTDTQPVQLTPDGLLTGVVIAASDFKKQPKRPPMVHEVAIDDCRLSPRLIVAMKGDQLRVRNTGEYPFMPAYGKTTVVNTLIRGQTYDVPLDTPGVSPLTCGFTAPCGRTDVIVMLHPVATVTDDKGHFKLDNIPAGEDLKISAWHPLFKESTLSVHVDPGETKQVELVLTPAAAPAPAPATPQQQPGAATAPKAP